MNTNEETSSSNRGRPRLKFKFPTGEFKIRELAEKNRVSINFVILKIKEAGDKVRELRKDRAQGQRGRAPAVYIHEDETDTSNE